MDAAPPHRVAVVIPCFNDGVTLPDALSSLEGQEPCELVVVDDGSTDPGTVSLFGSLEAEGVRVVHQPNRGLAAARTAGLHATSAPYVLALDADDRLVPGSLRSLADALDANPEAAVAWGDLAIFGRTEGVHRLARFLDPWLITYLNGLTADALVRREALLEVGGWSYRGGYEDWDLWMTLAERGYEGVFVPGVMHAYRVHDSRMLSNARENHDRLYSELRARHRALFERRHANWKRSTAGLRLRVLLPLIRSVPGLSDYTRFRVGHVVRDPVYMAKIRFGRRRPKASPAAGAP
jgi:glycosyltransferase involved in cell wall biosynthesis